MHMKWMKWLFLVACLYDGVLGIAFFLAPEAIFRFHEVEPPNHFAYVQFPALLLLIFAAMFFRIAYDPVKHRELVLYGIGLKLAYAGLAFWYDLTAGIAFMWMPWAWLDLGFLILFTMAWWRLGHSRKLAAKRADA